jgi:very-short-patch-repair endonuclease
MWHRECVPDRESLLNGIATDQRGVFTLAQAVRCGIPASTIRTRSSRGRYEFIHPRVYGIAGSENTWERGVVAAVVSATEPAAASHRTAAHLWGMSDRRPRTIEVVSPRHLRVKRLPYIVHESKDIRLSDIVQVDGIPVTTAVRTLVDLGGSASRSHVSRCLDAGLRTGLVSLGEIEAFVDRVARKGRTGVGVIRPLIEERRRWQSVTESSLEDKFRTVVSTSTLPMPEAQINLTSRSGEFVGRFDFGYRDCMAIFELDSERYHMDPVSFQRDRDKQNRAQMLGWTVYRITWRQLVDDPNAVISLLASVTTRYGRHGRQKDVDEAQ